MAAKTTQSSKNPTLCKISTLFLIVNLFLSPQTKTKQQLLYAILAGSNVVAQVSNRLSFRSQRFGAERLVRAEPQLLRKDALICCHPLEFLRCARHWFCLIVVRGHVPRISATTTPQTLTNNYVQPPPRQEQHHQHTPASNHKMSTLPCSAACSLYFNDKQSRSFI